VPDPRSPRGRSQPWRAILAIIVLAKLCGVAMGQRQIAEFARGLSNPQRRALGCRRDPQFPKRYVVPAESTYQRALATLDFAKLQPLLLRWQDQMLPADTDALIAIDGKHLRRSGGLAIASAIGQPSQRVHATVSMDKQESEIIAVRTLLSQTEFTGRIVALDSLHTQHETLQQILYEHGADYLVPLKENQKTILATARALLPEDFSPGTSLGSLVGILPGRPV
jgi:DDE_Tnp_1-associated